MNNNNGLGCFGNAIVILLVLFFFAGNIALFSGDMEDMGLAVAVAVIADSAIAIWLLTVIGKAVGSSYDKRHEKNITERKEVIVKEIGNKISHISEIQQTFDRHFEKIERQYSLVSLISSCMGTNNQELKNLLVSKKDEAFESTKSEIFDKLTETEKKRFPQNIAEVEDYEKTLEQEISELKTELNSVAASDDEQISAMIKKHCPEVHKNINRKRLKLIAKIIIPTTIVIVLISAINFANNIPYRELHSKIEDQSLTAEMLSWNNRENDDSYYKLVRCEKGYKFLASELTKLHRKNDVKKAMWLLCIQPDCIDGIYLCASDSFIDWVVNYARKNGKEHTDSKGNTTYSIDGYDVTISSIFNHNVGHYSGISNGNIGHYFSISDGQNGTRVDRKNSYHEGYVPTIQ